MKEEEILNYFANFIEREIGIIYSSSNYFQLKNRLEEISKNLQIVDIGELYNQFLNNPPQTLVEKLLDTATNNETSFFRDEKMFNSLRESILLSLCEDNEENTKINVWSAACSTGQEAVSLAITLSEHSSFSDTVHDFEILATDISDQALSTARKGEYNNLEIQRGMPKNFLNKYFHQEEKNIWKCSNQIMNKIQYKKVNLRNNFDLKNKFDLVLCRNVLIYQKLEAKIDIIKRISELLRPKGYLVLGSSESLIDISDKFEMQTIHGSVVYKKIN